ncbi:hypothetical protein [Pseudoduganella lutea]|uniref:Uncharacterized protein n=1 Tax=Pseudoduganella lutea TaxID=321985 RepID=A0A4P6KRN9_9BURK|nr:hypothetical protein [Pseudoduganella lutea]QBE61761.1 hypothetical protein EWM63_01070 [Pseudoduganella lutea]
MLRQQGAHMAPVRQPGQLIQRCDTLDLFQRNLQLRSLLLQALAHRPQLGGQRRDRGQHRRQHRKVDDLDIGLVRLWVVAGAPEHDGSHQHERIAHQQPHVPGTHFEHAEYYDHGSQCQHGWMGRPRDHVGRRDEGLRADCLGQRKRGRGEAQVEAAADGDIKAGDDGRASQRQRADPVLVENAPRAAVVQDGDADRVHARGHQCHDGPAPLLEVGGQHQVGKAMRCALQRRLRWRCGVR